MKFNKAELLYALLPATSCKEIDEFLTNHEKNRLAQAKILAAKNKIDFNANQSLLNSIQNSLRRLAQQKSVSNYFAVFFSANVCLALAFLWPKDVNAVYTFLIYAFAGSFIVSRKSNNFWRFHFTFGKLTFSETFFLAIAYMLTTLVLGLYNVETIQGDHHGLFLAQAFFFGPLFEELLFRQYLLEVFQIRYIKQELAMLISWVLSSIFFAVVHLQSGDNFLWAFGTFFTAGLVFCMTRWYLKKIFYSLLLHAMINATIFFL